MTYYPCIRVSDILLFDSILQTIGMQLKIKSVYKRKVKISFSGMIKLLGGSQRALMIALITLSDLVEIMPLCFHFLFYLTN